MRVLPPTLRLALCFAVSLAPPGAAAQETPAVAPAPVTAPAPPPPPRPTLPRVTLQTPGGAIVIALDADKAPKTAANFLKYVDGRKLDGSNFYRALKFPGEAPLGLIQGGVRGQAARSLPAIAHEPTSVTGLTHDDGAVSMARGAPGSAQGDFFIIIGNLNTLDANDADPGYAVFGHVVEGMDVVRAILAAPTSPTAGDGAMKGQMLAKPAAITVAKRVK